MSTNDKNWYLLFFAWVVSLIAMGGSLFFSQVMEFIPCELCWYQRIAMYPLVPILLVGIFPLEKTVIKFSLPLALIGFLIALYHNLLHWGIIPEDITPCREGVSCSTIYMEWLGFITIPFMSLVAFSLILLCLILVRKDLQK